MPTVKNADAQPHLPLAQRPQLRAIPASARVYEQLRDRIVGGEMLPATPVSEKELAEQYGVSRTPIREALLRLAEERLIDIFPQRGTFVSRISVEALRDGMVIREALECVAVRRAAARVTEADLSALRLVLDRQEASERASDWAGFHAQDEAFHQRIAILSGHPNLWRVARQEKVQIDRCRVLHLPISRHRPLVMEEHRAILDGLAARDPQAAERAMGKHLANVLPGLDDLLRARPDFFEPDAQRGLQGDTVAVPLRAVSRADKDLP